MMAVTNYSSAGASGASVFGTDLTMNMTLNVSVVMNGSSNGNLTPEEHARCNLYDFVMEFVLMGLLCIFGFCGNTLSILCLNRDKSKTATPFLLVSLELADTFFLVTVLILRVLTTFQTFTRGLPSWIVDNLAYTGKYVYPFAIISETATIYLTLLVTVNRYISVCRPYEASKLCSIQHAKRHVIIVVIMSIASSIPRFFEYEVQQFYDEPNNKTVYAAVPSNLAKNQIYQIVYSNVLYFLVMFFIPLVTLIILNAKLIKALRKAKRKRAQLLSSTSESNRSEDDITLVLIVVVLVFVVCQTPALVTQLLMALLPQITKNCPNSFFYYERISDLLVVANSSANFIIYCFCSRKFRAILVNLVCKKKAAVPDQSHTSRHYRQVPTQSMATNCANNATNGTLLTHVTNHNTEAGETKVSSL